MNTIYENITRLCQMRGITGAKMCRDIGIGKSMMSSLKSGRTNTINSKTAQKIADYFGVPIDHILSLEMRSAPGRCVQRSALLSLDDIEIDKNAPTAEAMSAKKEPAGFDEFSITKRELLNEVSNLSETEAALFLQLLKNALGKS